jgi:hypothetical protein
MKLPLAPSPWHPGQIIDADGFLVAEVRDTVQRMTVIEAINGEEYDHQTIENLVRDNNVLSARCAELARERDVTLAKLTAITTAGRTNDAEDLLRRLAAAYSVAGDDLWEEVNGYLNS